jgi:hypothetical protein
MLGSNQPSMPGAPGGGPLGVRGLAPAIETDVIFPATVLGFAMSRVLVEQPFSFDTEPGNDDAKAKVERVVAAVNDVLVRHGIKRPGRYIEAGVSLPHGGETGNLITGRPGGFAERALERNRDFVNERARDMGLWDYHEAADPDREKYLGQYYSYGAYTGMIDDPVGSHTLVQPTLRRVIDDPGRWQPSKLWGLVGTDNRGGEFGDNLSTDPYKGFGPLRRHEGIVQYVHGMSWAMREAVRWGPWCTPFEMAVGPKTTKRASCFACTTYMYAAGFPPSSTHIGSCISWGPLPDGTLGRSEDHEFSDGGEGEVERSIARAFNATWHGQMYHYLRQGAALLAHATLSPAYREAAAALASRFERVDAAQMLTGGNLFLDAITFHKPDTARLLDTLCGGA